MHIANVMELAFFEALPDAIEYHIINLLKIAANLACHTQFRLLILIHQKLLSLFSMLFVALFVCGPCIPPLRPIYRYQ